MNRDWDKLRRQDKAKSGYSPIASFKPRYSRKMWRKLRARRHHLAFHR